MIEVAVWIITGSIALTSLCALVCACVSVHNAMHLAKPVKKPYYGARSAGDISAVRHEKARQFIAFKTGGGDDD